MNIVAATRRLQGGPKRQLLIPHLQRHATVKIVDVSVPWTVSLFSRLLTIDANKDIWRERSKKNPYIFRSRSNELAKRIEELQPENVDVVLLFEGLYGPGIGPNRRIRYAVYEDTTSAICARYWPDWVPDSALTERYKALERDLYRGAVALFANTKSTAQSFEEDYGVERSRIHNIPLGVDLPTPRAKRAIVGPTIFLFVGFDFERKGGATLLSAFSRLLKEEYEAELLIVGPRLNSLPPGVTATGPVKDPATLEQLYRRADAFVIPAFFDPNPNAAIEAMSYELPVVTTTGCGSSEFIDEGVDGFVIETGDVAALVDRMVHMVKNPDKTKEMGVAAGMKARKHFSAEIVAHEMFGILRKTL